MVESQEAEINTSIGLINTSACTLFVLEEKKLTVLGRPNDTLNSIVVLAQHLDKASVKIPPFPTRKSAFFELLNQKTSKSLGGSLHLLIRLSNPAENPTLGVDPKQAVKTAAGWVKLC